ncbi:MAG: lipid A deacylase LpxR family protein [Paracraurococcus sp.]
MRPTIPACCILACASVLPLPQEARAEEATPPPADPAGIFAFILENDTFGGTDKYYTNGFLFAWRSSAANSPAWLERMTPGGLLFPEGGTPRWGLAFGQKKFTPEDTLTRDPDPKDRPYAGWLYASVTLSSYSATSYGSAELQLGVVEPSALGRQVQNTTHDILGIDRAYGWSKQLKDEPGVNLILSRQWRINAPIGDGRLGLGLVPSVTGSLGNVQTYAGAGMMFRIGTTLTADFGPPRTRPSSAGSLFFEPDGRWGWYAFAGFDGRVVGRDIFLDGNTWRDSRSVDKETVVADASLGAALIMPWARLTATYTLRSREFTAQREPAQFGSISLAFRF